MTTTTRRSFIGGAAGAGLMAVLMGCNDAQSPATGSIDTSGSVPNMSQPEPSAPAVARTVSISDHGGKADANDNTGALHAALQAAGDHGMVTFPAGEFKFTQPVTWPARVAYVQGSKDEAKPTVLKFADGVAHGFTAQGEGWSGSELSHVTLTGASGAHVYIDGPQNAQFVLRNVTSVDPKDFGARVLGASLYVANSTFMGQANGVSTMIHAMKPTCKVTVVDSRFTGAYRGIYCAGIGNLTVKNVLVDAMWWCGNVNVNSGTLTSAGDKDFATSSGMKAVSVSDTQKFTVTAWKQLTGSAQLSPVSGRAGWYSLSGVSQLEPRLLVRAGDVWATVLEVDGQNVRLANFYDTKTCHPVAAPTSSASASVERPYIAQVKSFDGTKGTVDRWRAGGKAAAEVPPSNARVQINPFLDYQIFTTNKSKSMWVTDCKVYNPWADGISSIDSANVYVANNEVWDGQDVGITLQQGTGACRGEKNTIHRAGSAGIFIGTSGAVVLNNTVDGASFTAVQEDTYGALQVEGAADVKVVGNTVKYGGAPLELRALLVEGRYGPFPSTEPTKGPFATGGQYVKNKFVGYPSKIPHVTVRGKNANAKMAVWEAGTRFEALDGASTKAIGGK